MNVCIIYSDMSSVNEVYSDMLLFIVTSPRNGPNGRVKRELLGPWGDHSMLPAASTMEMTSRSCSSLGASTATATHSMMRGSLISTLGGGGR